MDKTHFRKAFDSPYLSSADIVGPTVLTVSRVTLEPDKTKKSKDKFNTVYFVETELRQGEKLKPMILNATNSKTMKELTGSSWIEDWAGIQITVYVEHGVRFGRDTVDGLRIAKEKMTIGGERANLLEDLIRKTKGDGAKKAIDDLCSHFKVSNLSGLSDAQFKAVESKIKKELANDPFSGDDTEVEVPAAEDNSAMNDDIESRMEGGE